MTYIVVSSFWQLIYIARQVDHPFGDEPNDLEIAWLQRDLNESLLTLYQEQARTPPTYKGELNPVPALLRHSPDETKPQGMSFATGMQKSTSLNSQHSGLSQ